MLCNQIWKSTPVGTYKNRAEFDEQFEKALSRLLSDGLVQIIQQSPDADEEIRHAEFEIPIQAFLGIDSPDEEDLLPLPYKINRKETQVMSRTRKTSPTDEQIARIVSELFADGEEKSGAEIRAALQEYADTVNMDVLMRRVMALMQTGTDFGDVRMPVIVWEGNTSARRYRLATTSEADLANAVAGITSRAGGGTVIVTTFCAYDALNCQINGQKLSIRVDGTFSLRPLTEVIGEGIIASHVTFDCFDDSVVEFNPFDPNTQVLITRADGDDMISVAVVHTNVTDIVAIMKMTEARVSVSPDDLVSLDIHAASDDMQLENDHGDILTNVSVVKLIRDDNTDVTISPFSAMRVTIYQPV